MSSHSVSTSERPLQPSESPNLRSGKSRNVRRLPAWQISRLIRAAHLTQWDIGRRARVDRTFVSLVINRRVRNSPGVERVWRALEEALGNGL